VFRALAAQGERVDAVVHPVSERRFWLLQLGAADGSDIGSTEIDEPVRLDPFQLERDARGATVLGGGFVAAGQNESVVRLQRFEPDGTPHWAQSFPALAGDLWDLAATPSGAIYASSRGALVGLHP
jgi:hypothetical protein